jgi:Na+/melibiose symporter-like transporter
MSGSGRINIWLMSIGNVISRPAGWSDSEVLYAHNLWLDVSKVAGILPFLSLCIFTISSIILVYNIIKKSQENHFFNIIILSYFIGFMAVFFVEPIMEGLFPLFLIFCIFIGILSGYADNRNFQIKKVSSHN